VNRTRKTPKLARISPARPAAATHHHSRRLFPSTISPPCAPRSTFGARLLVCLLALLPTSLPAVERFVSPDGHDSAPGTRAQPWRSIQSSINRMRPGGTVIAMPGTYLEKVEISVSGSAEGGPITLQAEPGAIISGAKSISDHIIHISNRSYIRVIGFELRDNLKVRDGSGIRVEGECAHIELRDNVIHEVRGKDAMGITVYGTSAVVPITKLVIHGNQIYDCEPAHSEALVLNGNIDGFEVTGNTVRDVNNIGIDFIGGEKSICKDTTKVARNGVCRGNTVLRARSSYGGGYGAGIYVDGAKDILIEGNTVAECDIGIEVGAENKGKLTTGIVVRGNTLRDNDKAGLAAGGFSVKKSGRVEGCIFSDNVLQNNTGAGKKSQGEIWIQAAAGNTFEGNKVHGDGARPVLLAEKMAGVNTFKNNVWYSDKGAAKTIFVWRGKWCEGFAGFRKISEQGEGSRFEKLGITSNGPLEPRP